MRNQENKYQYRSSERDDRIDNRSRRSLRDNDDYGSSRSMRTRQDWGPSLRNQDEYDDTNERWSRTRDMGRDITAGHDQQRDYGYRKGRSQDDFENFRMTDDEDRRRRNYNSLNEDREDFKTHGYSRGESTNRDYDYPRHSRRDRDYDEDNKTEYGRERNSTARY